MADITEVVHKISYEVNDDALQNATKAIQQQITELERLNRNLQRYKTQLANTSRSEVQAIEQLGRKINDTNGKIEKGAGKLQGIIQQISDTALNTTVSDFTKEIVDGFKGLDGISFKSIGGLATNLLSFTNIAPLAISFLINLATKLFDTSKAASQAESSYTKFLKNLKADYKSTLKEIDSRIADSRLLIGTLISDQDRTIKVGAAKKLLSQYPTIFEGYTADDIADGKAKEETLALQEQLKYRELSNYHLNASVGYKEQLRAFEEEEARALQKKTEAEERYKQVKRSSEGFLTLKSEQTKSSLEKAANAIEQAEKEVATAQKKIEEVNSEIKKNENEALKYAGLSPDLSYDLSKSIYGTVYTPTPPPPKPEPKELKPTVDFTPKEPTEAELKAITDEIVQLMVNDVQEELDRQLQDVDGIEVWMLKNLEEQYQKDEIKYEEYEQRKTDIKQHHAVARLKIEEAAAKKVLDVVETDEQKRTARFDLDKATYNRAAKQNEGKSTGKNTTEEEEEKKFLLFKILTDEQRNNILEGIEGYQQLAQAAADAYNTILEAQIAALDKEISIREKRVTAATKLAEKGNTEVLRIEEQRLREAQKKREEAARKQILVNRALAISSSIAAVANAALAGDGYTAAARVIAIVAALAAGIAQVAALAGDSSPAFKDGVVDYKGKGGPKDDKNWVRISAGESVITADGTTKNRALLEAINNGASFQMVDASLPLFIPHFKQPNVADGQQYASAKELNGLSDKLDKVVDAIEDNKLRQNIFFDEHGVGIMTERAISKNRKRWK